MLKKKNRYPLAMLMPAVVFFAVFYAASIVIGFGYALTDWNLRQDAINYNGFENFRVLFSDDKFQMAVKNTIAFTIFTSFFKVGLGLFFAILLNRNIRGKNFFRGLFYLPCILSTLIVGYVFKFIYQPNTGALNHFLTSLGFKEAINVQWLGVELAMPSVMLVEIWMWIGYTATIFLAGLKSVPGELAESASIDGANRLRVFWNIVWPHLAPALTLAVTLNVIGGFKAFDLVIAMTNGGPVYKTSTISTYLYMVQARDSLGLASAVGVTQFVIITLVCIPMIYFLKRRERFL